MSEADFLRARNVSRETLERLRRYEALLRKWNPAINLVARSTLDQIWSRHFLDSTQLFDLAGLGWAHWADLGSGGGFPGLVVAVLAAETDPGALVTLIESDQRKAAFLMAAAREIGVTVTVRTDRVESTPPQAADILTARALAPLDKLLAFSDRHLTPTGTALFPKGANHAAELRRALESWRFSYEKTPSTTDPQAVVFSIKGISRV